MEDPLFVRMLVDEAKLAARIHHQNVVQTLDVVLSDKGTYVVMEYVRGVPLSLLAKRSRVRAQRVDPAIASAIMSNVLHGLHAAHEATDEQERPLGIVHRDVSPQNVLVGVDGAARVLDFGVAKAASMTQVTRTGYVKGKLAYIAPEYLMSQAIDRRADIFAAGVVLWELLTGHRLFASSSDAETIARVTSGERAAPSAVIADLEPFDDLLLSCVDANPDNRPPTARAMAEMLENRWPMAPASEVGEWVNSFAGDVLEVHRQHLSEIEAYDLNELIALPDQQQDVGSTTSRQTDIGSSEAMYEAQREPPSAPSTKGENEGSAPSVELEEEDLETERRESNESRRSDAMEPDWSGTGASRSWLDGGLVLGLVAGGLVVGIGAIAFGSRNWLSKSPEQPGEATSNAPTPTSSIAPDPLASTPIPTPIAPASAEPAASGQLPHESQSPTDERPVPREGPAGEELSEERVRPVPWRAPPAARSRQAASTDRSAVVRSFSSRSTEKKDDCSPPYRIDSDGIKIFKMDCL
jgi:serine/threonine-protein kinase